MNTQETPTTKTPQVTDASGATLECYDYLPFGRMLGDSINGRNTGCYPPNPDTQINSRLPQKFTGKQRDAETRLDFFGARYYSGAQARFTSSDPVTVTPARIADPQQLNLYAYGRNNPLKYVDPTGMIIDTNGLSEDDLKKWRKIVELANLKDVNGNFVNAKLHSVYDRLDRDERIFTIANAKLNPGSAGRFTITQFDGLNDFSKAKIELNFNAIKKMSSTTAGDFDPSFKKYEGLFRKNGFELRLAETFGHEGSHGIFAINDPMQGTAIQRLINERDAGLAALPKKGRFPLPPDILQKMQAAEQGILPSERFAQQEEKIINGELKANQIQK